MSLLNESPCILVTGASGWLGHRLVEALTTGIDDIPAWDNPRQTIRVMLQPGEPTRPFLELGAEVISGDIRDPKACDALCKNAEGAVLFHTAGIIHPPGRTTHFTEINEKGTGKLLDSATRSNVSRLIVVSSNSPFGLNPSQDHLFTEESLYSPYMGYGHSKWRMELLLQEAMRQEETPGIVIVRPPWFYGPGQPHRQDMFFRMIRAGKFPIFGKGHNKRSLGYVDSLVSGLFLSANTPEAAGETYWLADEKPYQMIEIIRTVKTTLKEDFGIPVVDRELVVPSCISDFARIADRAIQAAGLYHQKVHVLSEMNATIACDISKAKEQLGYKPLVSLREGMRRSIEWCLQNGRSLAD